MRSPPATSLLLAALGAGLAAAPALAHPPSPVTDDGTPIRGVVHSWIHAAKVPLVRGRVQIRREACPGHPEFVGCVFSSAPRTLYLMRGIRRPRTILYHELGHAFDMRVLNGRERRRFKRIIGIRSSGWFEGALPSAEWFADGYATCARRRRISGRAGPTAYGYSPTSRQHARVCRLIRSAAKPRGRPPKPPANPPPVIEVAPPPRQEADGGGDPICSLIDELLTDCTPPAPLP